MKNKQKLIYQSNDYSRFVQDDKNREASSHRNLRVSMHQYGWLPEHAAVVVPCDGGRFRVKDGGHRITIAKELGLPVYYTLATNDAVSIPDINRAQKAWSNADYVGSFIKQGNKEYARLSAFSAETGIPLGTAAALLSGTGSSAVEKVRSGKFKITNEEHARAVLSVVGAASNIVKWAKAQKFISAISLVLRHTRANPKTLCDKIRSHGAMLIPQLTTVGMVEMLENIYNYRNRDMVSISLGVKQALRENQLAHVKAATNARGK